LRISTDGDHHHSSHCDDGIGLAVLKTPREVLEGVIIFVEGEAVRRCRANMHRVVALHLVVDIAVATVVAF